MAAEVGRQPWIVYGKLRTSDALSPSVSAEQVLASIVMFGLIYAMLFAVFVYVLHQKIKKGPEPVGESAGEAGGLLGAAGELVRREGASLTAAHDDRTGKKETL